MDHPGTMALSARMRLLQQQDTGPGQPKSMCPFGCGLDRCDDNGYCRHLVGFTEDGYTMEVRERTERGRERTGNLVGEVLDDDEIVTPTPRRKNKQNMPSPTTTYRVYRQTGRAPYPIHVADKFGFKQRRRKVNRDIHEDEQEPEEVDAGAV